MTTKGRSSDGSKRQVTVVFPGRALAFDWPREATLADLVDYLALIGERDGRLPLSVAIRFDG